MDMHNRAPSERQEALAKDDADLVNSLLRKRDSLLRKLQDLDGEIEKLNAEKKPLEESLRLVEALLRLEGWMPPASSAGVEASDRVTLMGDVYRILQEEEKPLHYKEIAARLSDRGVYLPGKNPAATLLTRLTRDNRLKRYGRGTYGLASWRLRASKSHIKRARSK